MGGSWIEPKSLDSNAFVVVIKNPGTAYNTAPGQLFPPKQVLN
jgi:hypothetical protein